MSEKKPLLPGQSGNQAGRMFKPGQSGNPSGRPRGLERLVRETIGDDMPAIIRAQVSIAKGEKPADLKDLPSIKPADMTKAAEWLADRGWGKARATVDISTPVAVDTLDLTKMTTEELDDHIAKLEAEMSDRDDEETDVESAPSSPEA